jgi:hypothetical protein
LPDNHPVLGGPDRSRSGSSHRYTHGYCR